MARPQKSGLLYFPFDVDFFRNKKIKSLKARYGGNGIMLYLYLLTEIYHDNGYYIVWDEDSVDNAMDDLHLTEGFILQVMEYLISRSLLIKSTLASSVTTLSSHGIQKRYQEAVKGLKRNVIVNPDIWLLKEEDTAPFIKFTHEQGLSEKNPSKSEKNSSKSENNSINKIKRNEMKENKIKETKVGVPPSWYPTDENLNRTINDFIEYRKGIKAPMTEHSVKLLIDKLNAMTEDNSEKIKILEQSMVNGWKGIFYLNKTKSGDKPEIKKTRFTNYEEREWDFEELDRIKREELLKGVGKTNA